MKRINKHLFLAIAVIVLLVSAFLAACSSKKDERVTLPVPGGFSVNGDFASWQAVDNAYGYAIMIDEDVITGDFLSYSLSDLVGPKAYTVKVRALGDLANYKDSDWSEAKEYTAKDPTDGLTFTLLAGSGGYELTKGAANLSGKLTIPSVYNDKPVTNIKEGAFSECVSLSNIIIPDSVVYVGEGAFENTAWLAAQPDGIVYAGKVLYTYKGVAGENTMIYDISSKTVAIAAKAFYGQEGLLGILIPNSVTFIGAGAFEGCKNLYIYAEAQSAPVGWDENWKPSDCPVEWGLD